jgi:hypothetical protein
MRIDHLRAIHRCGVGRYYSSAHRRRCLGDADQRLQQIGLFVIADIAHIASSSFYLHSNVYFIITKLTIGFPPSNTAPFFPEAI